MIGVIKIFTSLLMYCWCRDVGQAVLQANLGHAQVPHSDMGHIVEGCQQQPCLVGIAGRALSQGCITAQDFINHASGELQNDVK